MSKCHSNNIQKVFTKVYNKSFVVDTNDEKMAVGFMSQQRKFNINI